GRRQVSSVEFPVSESRGKMGHAKMRGVRCGMRGTGEARVRAHCWPAGKTPSWGDTANHEGESRPLFWGFLRRLAADWRGRHGVVLAEDLHHVLRSFASTAIQQIRAMSSSSISGNGSGCTYGWRPS